MTRSDFPATIPAMHAYGIGVVPVPAFVNAGVAHGPFGYIHCRQHLRVNEIFVVEEGTLFMEADGRRSEAGRGSVLFHPVGAKQVGYAPSPAGVKFVWLSFIAPVTARELSDADLCRTAESIEQAEMTGRPTREIVIPALSRPTGFADVLGFAYRLAERGRGYAVERAAYVCLILNRLSLSYFFQQQPCRWSREARLVKDVKYWVEKELGRPLPAQAVARAVGMNRDYMNRVFRRTTGLRLSEYILTRKMERAKHLLRAGESVKEAAFRTGHSSAAHFSRKFRKHAGLSPSAYAALAGDIYRN